MKIGMVFYDMQEIGGLEEYAVSLAAALKQQGHDVQVLSTFTVRPDNQYARRLREHDIKVVHPPKWVSHPASHWPTKEKIRAVLLAICSPITVCLSLLLAAYKKVAFKAAFESASGWLGGKISGVVSPDRREPLAKWLLALWRFSWRPDILHLQGYTTNLLFAIDWAAANSVPIAYEEHQTPDPQFDWWQGFQGTINKADVVIAVSEKSAEGLRKVCGVTRPIVVRAPLLADPIGGVSFQQPHKVGVDQPLQVTTVARLAIAKGLTYLLEAIVEVHKKHPSTIFRVYGSGALRQELLDYARKLDLPGEEIFVGAFTGRNELTQIMGQTDIFVMSSILEGQPLGIVEAMAYGCPIVSTRVGGIPEIIHAEQNGLLCDPADPPQLAAQICRVIEDSTLRRKLGLAARQSYLTGPYQPEALANFFTDVYQDAVDQRFENQRDAAGKVHYSRIN